jgi:hypothetical protein
MIHWDTVRTPENPQGKTLLGDVWQDLQEKNPLPGRKVEGHVNASTAIAQEIQRRSPEQQSYSDSLVVDALNRFANLDAMKLPGAEFRDSVTVLHEQVRLLTPSRQRPCLPQTAAGLGHALRRVEVYLLGTLTIAFSRSNGRNLVILRRVER